MSCLINLHNVKKIYKADQSQYTILKNINVTIDHHEMVAIVGTSGSGKSTLMNILGFLDTCTEGRYLFENMDVSGFNTHQLAKIRNEKIGFVFQSFYLLPKLSNIKNVMLPLFYKGISDDVAEEKALVLLEKVGMKNFVHHKPNQLSGGQQQRVAIARSLICDPQIILADEPTGALDTKTGNEIMTLFNMLNEEEHKTIVIVTHDKEVSHRCKRMIRMEDGCIISSG